MLLYLLLCCALHRVLHIHCMQNGRSTDLVYSAGDTAAVRTGIDSCSLTGGTILEHHAYTACMLVDLQLYSSVVYSADYCCSYDTIDSCTTRTRYSSTAAVP